VLVQKTQNVIDPSVTSDAVLSHCLPKKTDELLRAQLDAFDQIHEHPYVRQHRGFRETRLVQYYPSECQFDHPVPFLRQPPVGRGRRRMGIRRRRAVGGVGTAAATGIQSFLLAFSGGRLIVRRTSFVGTLSAVVLPAAERTTQVPTTGAARMREKPNPAVLAVSHAPLQIGVGFQNRVQRDLILPDKWSGAIELVPIRTKREKLLDGDGKKARYNRKLWMRA
jgi:hypothetical protein